MRRKKWITAVLCGGLLLAQENRNFQAGRSALDRQEWSQAIQAFDRVIQAKDAQSDGALYWKAYALQKMGNAAAALSALSALENSYPQSRWRNDAKALEVEVRQASGQRVRPENEGDDDLKLLAINSLMSTDPERALPLLQKVLDGNGSLKMKERALFVLAQTGSAQGRDVLVRVARGQSHPELQSRAIKYLSTFGGRGNQQVLADIYAGTTSTELRKQILHSFMVMGDRARILQVAKSEKDQSVRMAALHHLGTMGGSTELAELYGTESTREGKQAIIRGLFLTGQPGKLIELAKGEKDPDLRREAVRNLGLMGRDKTEGTLLGLYTGESDRAVRREVLHALFLQGNVTSLVNIARKETDPELKREAVQRLSLMRSKEATDYMIELLNK